MLRKGRLNAGRPFLLRQPSSSIAFIRDMLANAATISRNSIFIEPKNIPSLACQTACMATIIHRSEVLSQSQSDRQTITQQLILGLSFQLATDFDVAREACSSVRVELDNIRVAMRAKNEW